VEHTQELSSLVYTPTVGHACQNFGAQFGRPRGMYFTRQDRGEFAAMVHNWPHDDVHVICVTDGSRTLGCAHQPVLHAPALLSSTLSFDGFRILRGHERPTLRARAPSPPPSFIFLLLRSR
jgi:hypothetical protein